jgi:DNA-binding response OmpR family regulator
MAAVCDLPSVLVVEGGDAADALERRLTHLGYRVFTAADGDAAMQALPDIDPDLVLLRRSSLRPVDPNHGYIDEPA